MRHVIRVLTLIPLGAALLTPTAVARAQEIQITGPLAGASAVRRMRIYRDHRLQLEPSIAFTLTDEFTRTILLGGQATYHISEWLGFGLWGAAGIIPINTDLTDQVSARGQTSEFNTLSLPSRQGFPDQIGSIDWTVMAQALFIPLRGKLALFQKLFVDTDFYVFAGAGVVGVGERSDVLTAADGSRVCAISGGGQPSTACLDTQSARVNRAAFAPTFGAGLTMYVKNFVGVSFEWRALPFSWNTSGTDEAGAGPDAEFPDGEIDNEDRILHFNHMVKIGCAFYLPSDVGITE